MPRIASQIPTEAAAYELLEDWRWHGKVVCPHCGSIAEHYFLTPRNGVSRETNRGTKSQRRLWKCRDCRAKFSVLTNTIMHGTHIPVRTWVFVFFELCASKNGIAAREIERRYDLAPKTAWFMLHRIREAISHGPGADLFSGVVVADEAWIGGAPKNKHANKRVGSKQGLTDKTPIVSLVHAESGEVRSQVVANVSGRTLKSVIAIPPRSRMTWWCVPSGEYVRDGSCDSWWEQVADDVYASEIRGGDVHPPLVIVASLDLTNATATLKAIGTV